MKTYIKPVKTIKKRIKTYKKHKKQQFCYVLLCFAMFCSVFAWLSVGGGHLHDMHSMRPAVPSPAWSSPTPLEGGPSQIRSKT